MKTVNHTLPFFNFLFIWTLYWRYFALNSVVIFQWRILEMSSVERRRLMCAILFHFVAAVCVIWSLFVLIDRAAEEVRKGLIGRDMCICNFLLVFCSTFKMINTLIYHLISAWPFWTKLVVVSVGSTGGVVFMYIQCRQYLHLFSRWKAHNR